MTARENCGAVLNVTRYVWDLEDPGILVFAMQEAWIRHERTPMSTLVEDGVFHLFVVAHFCLLRVVQRMTIQHE